MKDKGEENNENNFTFINKMHFKSGYLQEVGLWEAVMRLIRDIFREPWTYNLVPWSHTACCKAPCSFWS